MRSEASPPRLREVRLGPLDVVTDRRPDGTIYLRNIHPLGAYAPRLTERLAHWARVAPGRCYLAAREAAGGWRRISYREAFDRVRSIGAALVARGLSAERPIVILSGNDLEHALLGLAALHVGIAYAPISPAYSLLSSDFGKLRHILALLTPGLVFAADGTAFGRAIEAAVPPDVELVVTRNLPAGRRTTRFATLAARAADPSVDAAHAAIGPDTVAKILFTSGSTGMPKGVINTERMLCANQQQIRSHFAFFQDEPPVLLDWSPWNHTAGGNHNFNIALYNGGSFYLDEGRPTPAGIAATVRNLREVSPSWYFNVPRGYEALLPFLRHDKALCRSFFKRVRVLYYAGAGMARHVWGGLEEVATATYGERILMLSGLGSTETAPFALSAGAGMSGAGVIGLPTPGVELKLAPLEGKLEARVRGPNVTPGYWRQPELTAGAFDEEGYYRFGDALKFVDPADVTKGLRFDGRVAEDFKLATGTWVHVGLLRANAIDHLAPYAQDVVIAGPDRDDVTILVFPDLAACRGLCPDLGPTADVAAVLGHPHVRHVFQARLDALAAASTGSSNRICRALLLEEPPSIDRGEMTDKGSINQRAVLAHRAGLVETLYTTPYASRILVAEAGAG